MRVGFDIRLYSYRQAGIGNYALRMARELAAMNGDCDLTVYQSRKSKQPLVNARTHTLYTPCHHRFEQIALGVELATAGIDLFHSPDFIPPFYRRFRSVVTIHDLSYHFFPEFLTAESRAYYGQVPRALASADAVIVDAASTQRDLAEVYGFPAEQAHVVHLAPDEQFQVMPREDVRRFCEERGLPIGALLWVSTLEPRKNVPGLLRAYKQVREAVDAPQLLLAGQPGWLHGDIQRLVDELGLAQHVVFYRPESGADLPYLYNAARMLVFPSFYEGFGFPALEAFACGVPVICSDRGSLPEIVGDAAIQVAPEDTTGIAGAILRVLSDETLADSLKAAGFAQVKTFSWRRAAEETLSVYRLAMQR